MRKAELLKYLKAKGACAPAIRWVQRTKMPPSKLWVKASLEWREWLIYALPTTAPARKAYREAMAPADKAYHEAAAPARKAYDEAMAAADKAFAEARAAAYKAYREATAAADKAFYEAMAPALNGIAWGSIEKAIQKAQKPQ